MSTIVTGGGNYTAGFGNYIIVTNTTAAVTGTWTTFGAGGMGVVNSSYVPVAVHEIAAPILLQKGTTYKMPNGSTVSIDADGGFSVNDKDAKVIYRANRVYDFNPFLNASDLLEEYIKELVPHGVRQDEVLRIPIEKFIYWLVHRAAEKDDEPIPKDIPRLPTPTNFNRCRLCGRFIRNAFARSQIYFCSPIHMSEQLRRLEQCQDLKQVHAAHSNSQHLVLR
jgi:hypothetical protein